MPMCRGLELGFGVYRLGIRFWGLEIYEAGEEEERCGCAEAWMRGGEGRGEGRGWRM